MVTDVQVKRGSRRVVCRRYDFLSLRPDHQPFSPTTDRTQSGTSRFHRSANFCGVNNVDADSESAIIDASTVLMALS